MKNMNRSDKAILFIAGAMLVIFSYFLFDDSVLTRTQVATKNDLIGEVYQIKNDVRRKSQGDFSWLPTTIKDHVYSSDSVFTGSKSEVSIQLSDGSIIHVKENSLIALNVKEGQMELNLKYGDLVGEVKESSELTIRSGGEEFKLGGKDASQPTLPAGPSSVMISRSRTGQNQIHKVKGAPRLVSKKTGQTVTLQPAPPEKEPTLDSAPILPKAALVEVKPKIQLITPDRTLLVRKASQDPLNLEWKSEGLDAKDSYIVEIKAKNDVPEIMFHETTTRTKITLKTTLSDGDYSWRVLAQNNQEQPRTQSEYHSFQVVTLTAPDWIHPKIGSIVPSNQQLLDLEWTNLNAITYEWQISSDKEFQQIINQGQGSESKPSVDKPAPGEYWARVRGQKTKEPQAVLWTPWSLAQNFKVAEAPLTELPAPIPIKRRFDVDGATQTPRSPASLPKANIGWVEVKNADSYIVETSDDPKFDPKSKQTKKIETKKLLHVFDDYTRPKHFARVRAKGKNGILSPPSRLIEIVVKLPTPNLQPLQSRTLKSDNPELKPPVQEMTSTWTPVVFTSQYQIELAKSAKFEKSKIVFSPTPRIKLMVSEPGKYYARVRPLDSTQEPLTGYSNTINFEYIFKQTLRAPALAEPFNEATVFLQKDVEPFIWLEWKEVPHSANYEIQISNEASFKKVLIKGSPTNPRFLLKERVPYGKIFWRVRAIAKDQEHNSQWSPVRLFNLVFKKNEVLEEQ